MSEANKQMAAKLARQYVEKQIALSFLIQHYPRDTDDKNINSLFDLITISDDVDVIDGHAFRHVIITLIERLEKQVDL